MKKKKSDKMKKNKSDKIRKKKNDKGQQIFNYIIIITLSVVCTFSYCQKKERWKYRVSRYVKSLKNTGNQ